VSVEDYQNVRVLTDTTELPDDWRLYLATADRKTVVDLLRDCVDLRDILVAIVPLRDQENVASKDHADIFTQPTDIDGVALTTQRWTKTGATILQVISPDIDK